MSWSKTQTGGVPPVMIVFAATIYYIVLSALYPDRPYIPVIIVLGFFACIVPLGFVYERKGRERTALFRQGLRVEGGRMVLPEEAEVELGEVVSKDYWTRTPPDPLSAKARVRPFYVSQIYVSNPVKPG